MIIISLKRILSILFPLLSSLNQFKKKLCNIICVYIRYCSAFNIYKCNLYVTYLRISTHEMTENKAVLGLGNRDGKLLITTMYCLFSNISRCNMNKNATKRGVGGELIVFKPQVHFYSLQYK